MDHAGGARNRRLYKVTVAGLSAVTRWANEAPVKPPVLRHKSLLRVTFGNLISPARLKEILAAHAGYKGFGLCSAD